ncbi:BTAD domain-containing putative transcriptional regulator [Streptomyces griseus]|uniref:BTAD domain-containing putative transcriptional regulator n=1 Tax=Streptomyces griseus TaxID=1911 RepID=UPI00055D9CD5|nr:BTAD domain-containing putative transcriptional regulator [Streptomyces griseus]
MVSGGQRLDEGVIEVAARVPGRPGLTIGSGLLLPGGHVLTAAHLFPEPGTWEVFVRSAAAGDRDWLKGSVVFHRFVPPGETTPGEQVVDLAVVHCDDPRLGGLPGLPVTSWGRLVTGPCGAPITATGFPSGSAVLDLDGVPWFRDTAQIDGVIGDPEPRTRWREVRVRGPVPAPLTGSPDPTASRWRGMSGSGVLCNGLLVGVVVRAVPEPEAGRLFVQDLSPLWEDPGMRKLLRLPYGGPRAAELQPVLHPHGGHAMNSPVSLLRPEAAVVTFHGRDEELAEIARWRDGRDPTAIRLVTGPGGQGKTRLALAAVEKASAAGWAAGFLADGADLDELRSLLSVRAVPLLLVLDYAEARTSQLRSLCDLAAAEGVAGPGRPPIRILLLARKAGEWWSTAAGHARARGLLSEDPDAAPFPLPVLEPSAAARTEAARIAASDLGERLRELRPGTDPLGAPVPDVTDERFAGALNLQMTVLVAVLQHLDPVPTAGGEPDEVVLLLHEHRHWRSTADAFGLTDLPWDELSLLVTAATLCGARDETEALATLGRLPRTRTNTSRHDVAVRWLAGLYPSDGRYWGALQPDRLGEFLVGSVLRTEQRLLEWLLPTAGDRQVESAFHVLSRAVPHQRAVADRLRDVVTRNPGPLAVPAVRTATQVVEPEPLREALDAVLDGMVRQRGAAGPLARELYEAAPWPTLVLDRWAVRLAGLLADVARDAARGGATEATAELAGRLHRHAIRLGEVGRPEEALDVIGEAITWRRALAVAGGPGAEADLALSINTRTALLSDAGHATEALDSAQEVIDRYQRLAEHDPERYLPDLAMAETNLANQLGDVGRRLEAVEPARSAFRRYRALAADNPVHEADVALAGHNLAIALAAVGRRAEAVEAATDAVTRYRELARRAPDQYLPDLADALSSLADQLQEAGRHTEAERSVSEALDIYRGIAFRFPSRHLPNLPTTLADAVEVFRACGHAARALSAAEESVTVLRRLAERQPLVHRASLASALINLGNQHSWDERPEPAVAALEEAVGLLRQCCETLADTHRPALADALCDLGNYLGDAGRADEGVRAVEESVAIMRELAAAEPAARTLPLATAVDVLGNLFTDLGDDLRALEQYEEAYELLAPFVATEPAVFLEDLARVGANWSAVLKVLDRWSELLDLSDRTLELLRTASVDMDPPRAALAEVFRARGTALKALDRRPEAVDPFREAVLVSRSLVEDDPEHLPVLLHDLTHLASALSNVGRRREAAEVTAESVALHDYPAAMQLPSESRAEALVEHTRTLLDAGSHRGPEVAEETVLVCRDLAEHDPDTEPLLCAALHLYAAVLSREGLRETAVAACEEALRRHRQRAADVQDDPDAAAEAALDVASSAVSLAWALIDVRPERRAVTLTREAVRLLEPLSGDEIPLRDTELSAASHVLAAALTGLGEAERALGPALRAVDLCRALLATAPEVYASDLAEALKQYALALRATGRQVEAAAATGEALTLLRDRFSAEPAAHAFDLASLLFAHGRVLAASSAPDAVEALGEAVAIAERYGWQVPAGEAATVRATIASDE